MRYNISTSTAPKMPTLGRGTECIKLLLSQASKDMHEPLVPMLFPSLGAHMSGAEFQYPDNKWLEMCGLMANLVADSGCTKGQLSHLVEAICHDLTEHDEAELKIHQHARDRDGRPVATRLQGLQRLLPHTSPQATLIGPRYQAGNHSVPA